MDPDGALVEAAASGSREAFDELVRRHQAAIVTLVRALTAGRGVDVILDMVGGSYTMRNLRSLAPRGRLIFINYTESKNAEIDIALVLGKQLTITGSGLRPQTVERKAAIAHQLEERIWPLLAAGKIKPVIDSLYRLDDAAEAHRRMESSEHIGKIVLRMN